jgi:hypothetical protein
VNATIGPRGRIGATWKPALLIFLLLNVSGAKTTLIAVTQASLSATPPHRPARAIAQGLS